MNEIFTTAGVLKGMSGCPCILLKNNSDIILAGILIRANFDLSRNIFIAINQNLEKIIFFAS